MAMIRQAVSVVLAMALSSPALADRTFGGTVTASSAQACPITVGPITLAPKVSRASGVAGLLVFFDASNTTYSGTLAGANSAFQDLYYTWDFKDTAASGSGNWPYGSYPASSPKGTDIGGVAAHYYELIDGAGDQTYNPIATVTDGQGNTASCTLSVTVQDPAGTNGFPGTATTCVAASSTPVAGSGGCPSGAAVLQQSNFGTALSSKLGSGKRVLFHCGDTFTGDTTTASGTKWDIGAYGGCQDTQTNRPIFRDSGTTGQITLGFGSADGRISDIDFEGNGTAAYAFNAIGGGTISNRITLYNDFSNGNGESFYYSNGAEWGFISLYFSGSVSGIGAFANYGGNNPPQVESYFAALGNHFDGVGYGNTTTIGIETFRISHCDLCEIAYNDLWNANNSGAMLKIHDKNTFNGNATWVGAYSQYISVHHNYFFGKSGTQSVEFSPQNASDDERLRLITFEANVVHATNSTGGFGGKILVSAVNWTGRNNITYVESGGSQTSQYGIQVAKRGIEPTPTAVEVYNTTCVGNQWCVGFDGLNYTAPGNNSFAQNTLYYDTLGTSYPAVVNNGTGNTVNSNTTSPLLNPGFSNGSGSFSLASDFKPSANFSGGAGVPNYVDAVWNAWSPTWNLGAVKSP